MSNSDRGVKSEASPGTFPWHEPDRDATAFEGKIPQSQGQHLSGDKNSFHFDDIDGELQLGDKSRPNESCIGLSIDHVFGTLKGEQSYESESSGNNDQRGFFFSIKAMLRKSLLPSTWSESINTPRTRVDETLDDYDLMNRLPSWKTLETPSVYRSRTAKQVSTPKKSHAKQVQFQYPPITSIRLRPRTESDEIDRLYFAPDELDQIEDDRSDTKAADDIETLCVIANPSEDTDSLPGVTESYDSPTDTVESSAFPFISRRKTSSVSSSSNDSRGKKKRKGIVRGVQIMLREKSLG